MSCSWTWLWSSRHPFDMGARRTLLQERRKPLQEAHWLQKKHTSVVKSVNKVHIFAVQFISLMVTFERLRLWTSILKILSLNRLGCALCDITSGLWFEFCFRIHFCSTSFSADCLTGFSWEHTRKIPTHDHWIIICLTELQTYHYCLSIGFMNLVIMEKIAYENAEL